MEQFIKNLKNLDQEPSFVIEESGYQLEMQFTVKASKGDFTQDITYNCTAYKSAYEGYYGLEIHDCYHEAAYLGGLKVDNLDNLKNKLEDWGFKGLADKLEIKNLDADNRVYEEIHKSVSKKNLFKGSKLFDLLTPKEKIIVRLKSLIKLYNENEKVNLNLGFNSKEKLLMPTNLREKYEKQNFTILDIKSWLNELEG